MIKVGDKLKEERKKRNLTLEEVAKATRIRPSFLDAIEKGDYAKLPGSSYAHGFVKNYLEFLGLPVSDYVARFRREYNEKEARKLIPEGFVEKESISLKRFSLTQAVWVGAALLVLLFVYLLFQYRAAFWSPYLAVSSPQENAVIAASSVTVSGTTDENTTVTVNTLPAYVDNNGRFIKELPLFPGKATITVKAVNSFGKVSTIERDITVQNPQ